MGENTNGETHKTEAKSYSKPLKIVFISLTLVKFNISKFLD